MKASELRAKPVEDMHVELLALLKQQFNLRMQHATGQLQATHHLKVVRRDIARLKTILSEKVGGANE